MRTNGAPDHIITTEEFEEYYNSVSASIDDDQYFSLMMNNAWNLDGTRVTKKGWSNASGSNPITGKKNPALSSGGKAAAEMPPMNYTDAQLVDKFR